MVLRCVCGCVGADPKTHLTVGMDSYPMRIILTAKNLPRNRFTTSSNFATVVKTTRKHCCQTKVCAVAYRCPDKGIDDIQPCEKFPASVLTISFFFLNHYLSDRYLC